MSSSTEKLPLATVVIASHNYGKFLPDAIASAVKQDYPNKQVFVADDGSTDNTADVMRSMLASPTELLAQSYDSDNYTIYRGIIEDTPVCYMRFSDCKGQAKARNSIIETTWENSHFFAVLDADDIWLPGKLSKSIVPMIENPEFIGAVYSDCEILVTETGRIIREFREPFSRKRLLQTCIVHSGCVISKLALSQVGLFDETMPPCEDYDLWVRISEKMLIHHLAEPLVITRVTGLNCGLTVPIEKWNRQVHRIFENMMARRNGKK